VRVMLMLSDREENLPLVLVEGLEYKQIAPANRAGIRRWFRVM